MIQANESQLNLYNGFNCSVQINSSLADSGIIGPLDFINLKHTSMSQENIINLTFQFDNLCDLYSNGDLLNTNMTIFNGQVSNIAIIIFFYNFCQSDYL